MNALQLLTRDHEKLKQLFGAYDAVEDSASARRQQIAEDVFRELQIHSRLEEEIFYPALNARAGSHGRELVEDGLDAHAEVDEMIQELKLLGPEDPDFDDKFQELADAVTAHIEDEESAMFPEAERKLGAELEAIGRALEEEKAAVLPELL